MKSYRYADGEYEVRTEIKRSVFIATISGELDESGAEEFVKSVKKRYPDATHNCYAYVADVLGNVARFSDDGEPSGTAGQPILEVLKKQGLKKSAIVVTRYFGGVKLGASGLVGAYSGIAAEAASQAKISEKFECREVSVDVGYAASAQIERLFRRDGALASIDYDDGVRLTGYIPIDLIDAFKSDVSGATFGKGEVTVKEDVTFVKLSR